MMSTKNNNILEYLVDCYLKAKYFFFIKPCVVFLNILKRGAITYYSVHYDQHKDYCDFHSSDMIDVFLDSVYQVFCSENSLYKF